MRYGNIEWQYAEPIARALVESQDFRGWVLSRTQFAPYAAEATLLHTEMKARRSASAETWWRSHFTEKCRCRGCSGQETDLLAIFDARRVRFALHLEIKRPGDKFPRNKDQAQNYGLRALCWARTPPYSVLPHHDADTMLIFSESQREEFSPHLEKFGRYLTFEEVGKALPADVAFPAL